jgi:hypothetical protein
MLSILWCCCFASSGTNLGVGWISCPACGDIIKTSVLPVKWTVPVTITLALCLCFYFGMRALTLFLASIIAAVPLYFVVYAIIGLIYPPGLELVSKRAERLDK